MFKYSFDFKFKAVKYVVYGKHSYREAARKFNVHQEQIGIRLMVKMDLYQSQFRNMMANLR